MEWECLKIAPCLLGPTPLWDRLVSLITLALWQPSITYESSDWNVSTALPFSALQRLVILLRFEEWSETLFDPILEVLANSCTTVSVRSNLKPSSHSLQHLFLKYLSRETFKREPSPNCHLVSFKNKMHQRKVTSSVLPAWVCGNRGVWRFLIFCFRLYALSERSHVSHYACTVLQKMRTVYIQCIRIMSSLFDC